MERIDSFTDKYSFLSNFYLCRIVFDGIEFPSVEHAYQAAKTLDQVLRKQISKLATAAQAKKQGQTLALRYNWELVKEEIMFSLLKEKFQHPKLKSKLLETGTAQLVEGNWWGDTYWGICKGKGSNRLGSLLMDVRRIALGE